MLTPEECFHHSQETVDHSMIEKMDVQTISIKLQKGYEDMLAGRVKPAKEVFSSLREKYHLSLYKK